MQHGLERSFGNLVFEDAAAILVRLAGVDDQRQTSGAGSRDMGAKAARLCFARAVLIEVIQPRLAQRDDFRMLCQFDQFG